MRLECQYNRDLFDAATVRALARRVRDAAARRGRRPDARRSASCRSLADDDRRALARVEPRPSAPYPRDARVEELFVATSAARARRDRGPQRGAAR